jgi:hypothetical protein
MIEERCLECGAKATWMRSTQFAGDHPYCEEHAKLEKDFGVSDSYGYWYEIKISDPPTEQESR